MKTIIKRLLIAIPIMLSGNAVQAFELDKNSAITQHTNECLKSYALSKDKLTRLQRSSKADIIQQLKPQVNECKLAQALNQNPTKKSEIDSQLAGIKKYTSTLIEIYSPTPKDDNATQMATPQDTSSKPTSEKETSLKACNDTYDASALSSLATKKKGEIEEKLMVPIDACIKALKSAKVDNSASAQQEITARLTEMKDEIHSAVLASAPSSDSKDHFELLSNLSKIEKSLINKINKAIEFNEVEYEIPPWREEAFTYQFYAGLEATTINELFEETNVRTGLQLYSRFTRDLERLKERTKGKCSKVPENKCHDWGFDFHLYGNINITTVGEHSFISPKPVEQEDVTLIPNEPATGEVVTSQVDGDTPEGQEDISQALVGEVGLFIPVNMSIDGNIDNDNYQELMVGPIFNAGFNFTDKSQDHFNTRYYWGLRAAHNEETYFDMLYGKTEGIKGRRLELRGQFPVSTFAGGRLFLGGRANLGIDKYKKETEDAWQIYLQWQTSFDALWDKSKAE